MEVEVKRKKGKNRSRKRKLKSIYNMFRREKKNVRKCIRLYIETGVRE